MRLAKFIKRRGAKSGATALEFAFVAPILFVLMFAIIEAGGVFIGQAWMTYATNDMAREIRTGQIQLGNIDKTTFRNMVCDKLNGFFACDSNLQIDVQAYPSFSVANFGAPLDASGNLNGALNNYNPGQPCQVVLVRDFYIWKIQTPLFTPFLVNMTGGSRLITAAAAFRNEPFNNGVQGC